MKSQMTEREREREREIKATRDRLSTNNRHKEILMIARDKKA
jgi:hypothetical protein